MDCFVQTFPPNTRGRDLITTDIHGHIRRLYHALQRADFDPSRDRVFSAGDMVNRGPDHDLLLSLLREKWFFSVRGNHDDMALAYISNILNGQKNKNDLLSVGLHDWTDDIQDDELSKIAEEISKLPYMIEIEQKDHKACGIVHAEVPLGQSWQECKRKILARDQETILSLTCGRERAQNNINARVEGIERIFVGHSDVRYTFRKDGPHVLGNIVYIETGVSVPQGYLTLADICATNDELMRPRRAKAPKHDKIELRGIATPR